MTVEDKEDTKSLDIGDINMKKDNTLSSSESDDKKDSSPSKPEVDDEDEDEELKPTTSQTRRSNPGSYPDQRYEITYARRIARYLSDHHDWYDPQASRARRDAREKQDDELKPTPAERPSLDAAWAFFEHIALPRYIAGLKTIRGKVKYELAEIGEDDQKTLLFPIWKTPAKVMGEFGIGVGLYFSTLLVLAWIMLGAFAINIPAMRYFASTSYTSDAQNSLSMFLRGSSICTDTSFLPCPNCTKNDWNLSPQATDTYAEALNGTLRFIRVNNCSVGETVGSLSYASLLFVYLGILLMIFFLRYRTVYFDEAVQTAQDYSIIIENPDPHLRDPEKYKKFFENLHVGIHVTTVTIAMDNDDLMNLLIQRRRLLAKIDSMLPFGESLDYTRVDGLEEIVRLCPSVAGWKKILCCSSDAYGLYKRVKALDKKIDKQSKKPHFVSKVFVTFETEQAQRKVLRTLLVPSRGDSEAWLEDHWKLDGRILKVGEPDEPESIRWFDLSDQPFMKSMVLLLTNVITLGMIAACAYAVYRARKISTLATSLVITTFNSIVPMILKSVNDLEKHPYESNAAASQYVKVTLFRWVNTAIIISVITPFTDTINAGNKSLISSLEAIFITEMIKRPLIQYIDYMGLLNRHILGPRAVDQRRMNAHFQGALFELEEKYTDITKMIFLTVFYAAIYPIGFLWTFIALIANYWVDKFSILRIWRQGRTLGKQVSVFSSQYFFPLCNIAYAVMAAYLFSGYPFDNACEVVGGYAPSQYIGSYNITILDGLQKTVNISSDTPVYQFCDQNYLRPRSLPLQFPPLPNANWMTASQLYWTHVFGWTCVAIVVLVGLNILRMSIGSYLWSMFVSPYYPVGKASHEKFSQLIKVNGYVPQVRVLGYAFPLLMCDIDDIDIGLIGWEDPENSYDMNNLIFDVPRMRDYKKKQLIERLSKSGDKAEEIQSNHDENGKGEGKQDGSKGKENVELKAEEKREKSKEAENDDKKAEMEGKKQKKKTFLERFKKSSAKNEGKKKDDALAETHQHTIENPCFHIIQNWEPPVDAKDAIPSTTTRFEAWEFREKMLMGKQD